jgi:hypothetical protein
MYLNHLYIFVYYRKEIDMRMFVKLINKGVCMHKNVVKVLSIVKFKCENRPIRTTYSQGASEMHVIPLQNGIVKTSLTVLYKRPLVAIYNGALKCKILHMHYIDVCIVVYLSCQGNS